MKYRKKPVVVEAVQWTGKNFDEVCNFMQENHGHKKAYENAEEGAIKTGKIYIKTDEGIMEASTNDWIIKGLKGEFYPCKPDIFEKSYDLAEEAKTQPAKPINYLEAAAQIADQMIMLGGNDDFSKVPAYRYDELQNLYTMMNGGKPAENIDKLNALKQAHSFIVGRYQSRFAIKK